MDGSVHGAARHARALERTRTQDADERGQAGPVAPGGRPAGRRRSVAALAQAQRGMARTPVCLVGGQVAVRASAP